MRCSTFIKPNKPTLFKTIEYDITLSAKEFTNMIFDSLNEDDKGFVKGLAIATFIQSFFNLLNRTEAEKVIAHLTKLNMIASSDDEDNWAFRKI
jgi:hypothetical protein